MNVHIKIRNMRRAQLEAYIEDLIAFLDLLDGDENLEPFLADTYPDVEDREEENENGGDVQDEPHDALDEGNDEPSLGLVKPDGPSRPRV